MATLDIESVIDAVRDLVRAGRWDHARHLLDATEPDDGQEAGAVAVARADAEVEQAWWTHRDPDGGVLEAARSLAADSAQAWTVDFAALRSSYAGQLRTLNIGGPPDPAVVDRLAADAERLAGQAPDPSGRAYATFYRGLIADLLRGDGAAGEQFYRAALDTDDGYVRSYALRHLGGRAEDAGRRDEALELLRESTRLRQQAGFVPGALAQLVMVDGGSPLVTGWADALGIGTLIGLMSATEPEVARDPA